MSPESTAFASAGHPASFRRVLGVLLMLVLAAPVLAQDAQTATSGADDSAARLMDLRQEAQRLTGLAAVPEEGRAEAEELWARAEALRERDIANEIARLEAYNEALRSGDSPAVAQQVAADATGEAGVELARDREALRSDVESFLETYPEAAAAVRPALVRGPWLADDFGPFTGSDIPFAFERRQGGFQMALPYGAPGRMFEMHLPNERAFPGQRPPAWR